MRGMDGAHIEEFQSALLDWYGTNARELPFRETRDPYAIWVSEIMLQQTTVAAVTPYWERFLRRFPSVSALAEAALDDVLHAWAGLGYYARARNMHRAAREIIARHGGAFPRDFAAIRSLPGIGRYTAGAVASFAFNDDQPVVDANVARVLARIETIPGDPRSGPAQRTLWEAAETLLPAGRARDWNHALFDLGATVCLPSRPLCLLCPVSAWCEAFKTGRQSEYPQVAPRAPMEEQIDVAAVIRDPAGRLLMIQRPETGVWAGLWELPRGPLTAGESPSEGLARILREGLGMEARIGEELATLKHTVMRRRITLRALHAEALGGGPMAEGPPRLWVEPENVAALALSSPQRRILRRILFLPSTS